MSNIHKTAIVGERTKIADNVKIGPYCIVGNDVVLEEGVHLVSHVCIDGFTLVGKNTKIFPFASIGLEPQDKKYQGEKSKLIIGQNNKIREYVTIHPGTAGDKMETKVGDNCLIMISAHIAHDCIIGNNVILANNSTLAGHVEIGDNAIIGGLTAIHQFVRIGEYAIIGGMSGVAADVIPYGNVFGERASLAGLNIVGLKRHKFGNDEIHDLRKIYSILFQEDKDTFELRLASVEKEYINNKAAIKLVEFLKQDSNRAICLPRKNS
jgi:UDP-N-acetylglucosamine acyltransferase